MPLNQMDLLEKRTQHLCFWISRTLRRKKKGRDSLYTFLSIVDINFSLLFLTNELMHLALSTNSTNYIKLI